MTSLSHEAALAVLADHTRSELERTRAIHVLAEASTPLAIEQLVKALEDRDPGVRWAAAKALAHIGEPCLPPLLRALADRPGSVWLREGARHALRTMQTPTMAAQVRHLLAALTGPGATSATEAAAYDLLAELARS